MINIPPTKSYMEIGCLSISTDKMEVATGCEQANNEAKLASKCFEPHTIAKLKKIVIMTQYDIE